MSGLRTPLHDLHVDWGARMTPFAGYEMPLLYSGIVEEHETVRSSWGLFDVSHMGNLDVPAGDAEGLARAVAADARRLKPGTAKYTVACREDGTVLDDLIVYRLDDHFHVVPNAGNHERIAEHIRAQGAEVADHTADRCILAVQGPSAPKLGTAAIGLVEGPGRFKVLEIDGGFVAGTGYTGESGFECVVTPDVARELADALVDSGATPCGLGARDTLRLEKGYVLAGNEFDPPRTPVEAGLMWTTDMDHEFVGRDAIEAQRETGPDERLVGLEATERGIPRRGHDVLRDDERVGTVSSGTQSPTLDHGIALAYAQADAAEPGTELEVQVRPGRTLACHVVDLPFL